MAKSNNQKAKILYLEKMLRETGEHRVISMQKILENLEKQGIRAERKSIYDDVEVLRSFGMDIRYTRERPGGYYLAGESAGEEQLSEEPGLTAEAKDIRETKDIHETSVTGYRKLLEASAGTIKKEIKLLCTGAVQVEVRDFFGTAAEYKMKDSGDLTVTAELPENGKFWVAKASSIKSKLFSPSDIQSIMKKAMVERMKEHYHVSWFPEDGAKFPLRVFLYKDIVTIGIDTSGDSLHKRGYRTLTSKAPITETLAAALIMLTPWNKDRILVDPFCGSGTFPIEAAMMAANMAPGMNRSFLSEDWKNIIKRKYWYEAMDEANDLLDDTVKVDIQGYDIDGDIVKAARANAQSAGVDHMIHFQQRPVNALSHPKKYGFIISNPPYGERIEEKKNLPALYTEIGERFAALDAWSMYLITSYEDAEKYIGRKADKNRKIYNGMLKTYFYQFMGPRPPKRSQENRNVD